jgi:palmitoyltransferase
VFGDKARSLVLSIERCCCDRPNPVLQAILSKPTFFFNFFSILCFFLS